jgi:hypothetical protein
MRIVRSIMLAMAATLGASGCRAWSPGPVSLAPRPIAETTFDVDKFVDQHNRNAALVQSLEAKPTIGVRSKLFHGSADGRLALERPRNFKLELSSMGAVKADIGSNDDEFWFWVDNEDRKVYWCNHEQIDSSKLAVIYQPDRIVEALGLKPITPEEAAGIKVHEGDLRGTTALVFPARKSGGETYTRMMIVWNQNRRVKEHRIYEGSAPTNKGLLAQAEVSHYVEFDTGSSDAADGPTCYLPENMKLEWKRDQLVLDVVMQREHVKVNQFDSSRSAALFVEPVTGHDRVNLAELRQMPRGNPRSTLRRTLPQSGRNGAKPGASVPDADDATIDAGATSSRARSRRPLGSATTTLEDLVTAPLPVAPDTAAMRSTSTGSSAAQFYQFGR